MCSTTKYLSVGIAALIVLLSCGCSYKSKQMTVLSEKSYSPVQQDSVEVISVDSSLGSTYEVVGRVYVRKKGTPLNQGSPKGIRKDIQASAAKMGADAVIGFYTSVLDDHGKLPHGCWGSGIAVKKLASADAGGKKPPQCAVLMVSPNAPSLLPFCQVHLEKKGYYAASLNQKLQAIDMKDADSLTIDSLVNQVVTGGFSYLLKFELLSSSDGRSPEELVSTGYSQSLAEQASQTLSNRMSAQALGQLSSAAVRAALYSVPSGELVWEKSAKGTESLFLNLQGQLKTGTTNAIKELFKTLPPFVSQ